MTFEQALTAMKEGKTVTNGLDRDITYSLSLGKISTEEIDIDNGEYSEEDIADMVNGAIEKFTDLPIRYFNANPNGDVNLTPEFVCHHAVPNVTFHYTFTDFDLIREDWQIGE